MIYMQREIISRRGAGKCLIPRLAGEKADRDDLSNGLELGAKWAIIRHETPLFRGRATRPRGENLGFPRKPSCWRLDSIAQSRGDINKSAEI